jgi:hypothetical protein
MNSKSKIILGLSAILAMSAGVAATSTFAWFSTNHTTSVSITNIGVRSNNGNLWVEAGASTDANAGGMKITTAGTESVTPQIEGVGSMYDVSGDGVNFYQPQWNTNSVNKSTGIGTAAHGMNVADNATDGKLSFRQFNLTFHNGNADSLTTDPSIAVYIDSTSTITKGNTNDNSGKAADCTRVAILDSTGASVLFYWQRSSEDVTSTVKYTYIKPDATVTDPTKGIYGVAGYVAGDASTITTAAAVTASGSHNVLLGSTPIAVTDGSGNQAKQKIIASINPGSTATVMVRIWCEGTCSTCSTDAAAGGVVAVNLGFAAI